VCEPHAALPTHSNGETAHVCGRPNNYSKVMGFFGSRCFAVILSAAFIAGSSFSAVAQSTNGEQKPADQQKAGEAAKTEAARRAEELAEAARVLTGPAANPECVWLGRRVVRLLSQDDLDTAFRHLDIYDRFGCPGAHIQAAFRCLIRQGVIDPKSPETLDARVHSCWINPNATAAAPQPPAAPAAPPAAASGGTGAR
jgi:hypothetical protein